MAFDPDKLEEKLEQLKLENELLREENEVAQQKAMMREFKAKYGKDWKVVLNGLRGSDSLKKLAKTSFRLES